MAKSNLLNPWDEVSPNVLSLTDFGLMMLEGINNFSQIGPGNVLLPDGTKPLHEPMLTYHQQGSPPFTSRQ